MALYKNQKTIKIDISAATHKENTSNAFVQPLNWEPLSVAMSVLTGNEFKVFLYLFKWAGKNEYFFSPTDLSINLGMSEDTARDSLKKLINLEYVKQISTCTFTFSPVSEKANEKHNILKAERILKSEEKHKRGGNT